MTTVRRSGHQSEVRELEISGVRVKENKGYQDRNGMMGSQAYSSFDEDWFVGYADLLLMMLPKGATRPFHYHNKGTDTMAVVSGAARIVLCDLREDSPTHGKVLELDFDASASPNIKFIQVPPRVAHGFQGLSEHAVLVDLANNQEQSTTDFIMCKEGTVPYQFQPV